MTSEQKFVKSIFGKTGLEIYFLIDSKVLEPGGGGLTPILEIHSLGGVCCWVSTRLNFVTLYQSIL